MLEKRAREQYDLTMNVGPFGIDSRPALIVEKYAETQGKGEAFHKAVMQAYWQQARSIDEKAVLQEIAEQVGLSTENFDDVLASPSFDEEVAADVELAHEYGLTGVPALIFADRYLVVGAQPFDTLHRLFLLTKSNERIRLEVSSSDPSCSVILRQLRSVNLQFFDRHDQMPAV